MVPTVNSEHNALEPTAPRAAKARAERPWVAAAGPVAFAEETEAARPRMGVRAELAGGAATGLLA